MLLYKDILTDAELFTDTFPMKLIDDVYYEVEGKIIAESSGDIDDSLIGGNKSAEEPTAEEFNPDTVYGCNIVLNHGLEEVPQLSKKEYGSMIKTYAKAVLAALNKQNRTEDAKIFQEKLGGAVKKIKEMWDDLVPYWGAGTDLDSPGMIAFMNYREDGNPYMIFFKHGLVEEKQ